MKLLSEYHLRKNVLLKSSEKWSIQLNGMVFFFFIALRKFRFIREIKENF